MQIKISKKILFVFLVLIFTTSMTQAAIFPSDVPDYEVMVTGNNYTAYFSQFDTNGFTYVISDHRFSFLPRKLLYTDDNGTPTLILGRSHFTQL